MAQRLNYWRLAIWKGITGSLVVILGATPSVVLNWDTMTTSGRTVAVSGLLLAWIKYLDGFTDQTASRLAAGKPAVSLPPVESSGHTEVILKPTEHPKPL
jgi:hypothetical protein